MKECSQKSFNSKFLFLKKRFLPFQVGKPENKELTEQLEQENRYYGDLIVTNAVEEYYKTTLKMLIGYKYVSCFCSHADYVIKSDDDNYIRVEFLDQLITKEQETLDASQKVSKDFKTYIPKMKVK